MCRTLRFSRSLQAGRWYHKDWRGGTQSEALVLSLLVARSADGGVALSWAKDVLKDVNGYVDGAAWKVPDDWRLTRQSILTKFADELLAKVLKQELQEGICIKIVDDVYVGGDSQEDAAENYFKILKKLSQANLKITAEKTKIFPKETD